jgi:sterol 3beta-glucosyltransferase
MDAFSDQLAIYALSPSVVPRPPALSTHFHFTGYFYLEEEYWKPDAELEDFLSAGTAPVVLSFSSMIYNDADRLTELIVEASRAAKCRAVIQRGWTGLGLQRFREDVYITGYVPHQYLFSRACCIIHHGGSGTTAAVFRAGKPSVVVPYIQDQPFWAWRAEKLGTAGPSIPYSELTADRLARSIIQTLATPRYERNAKIFAARIQKESGVRYARTLIEGVLKERLQF